MGKKFTLKKLFLSLPAYFICFSLLSPFLFFLIKIKSPPSLESFKFFFIFLMTVFQSGVSAMLSLFLAILGSRGLLSIANRKYYFFYRGFDFTSLSYTSFNFSFIFSSLGGLDSCFSFWFASSYFISNSHLYRALLCGYYPNTFSTSSFVK